MRLPGLGERIKARRIDEGKGIILGVGIAVKALAEGVLDDGVSADEAPQRGVVEPRIHVDQAHLIVHLMAGEALGGGFAHLDRSRGIGPGWVSALAVGVVGQALDDSAVFVGEGVDRTHVIGGKDYRHWAIASSYAG